MIYQPKKENNKNQYLTYKKAVKVSGELRKIIICRFFNIMII